MEKIKNLFRNKCVFILTIMVLLCFAPLCVKAEEVSMPETISLEKTGWQEKNGNIYYVKRDHTLATGLLRIKGYVYYFQPSGTEGVKGRLLTGERKIKGKEYFFRTTGKAGIKGRGVSGWVNLKRGRCYCINGKIQKNRYVEGYYVGRNGAMSRKSKHLYELVRKTIRQQTTSKMTKSQKLRKCYQYLVSSSFTYTPKPIYLNRDSWKMDAAYEMLTTKKGKCYHFAAAFGFIAREIGYENLKIIPGKILSVTGYYTAHSWVEMQLSGRTYIFDPSMEHGKKKDFYRKTYVQTGRVYVR